MQTGVSEIEKLASVKRMHGRLTRRANRGKRAGNTMSDTHRLRNPGNVAHLREDREAMLDTDDPALWYGLNRLLTNYWADVDHNGGSQAHVFKMLEALYAVGHNRFEGAEKIRAFYARRRERGNTTTRHLVGNLQVFRHDARRAQTVGVMSLYRADGRPPFQWVRPPAMIADFEAQCVLGDDRLWRFQSHILRPIFVGSDLPASISIDPQRL